MAICIPENEKYRNEEEELVYKFIKKELDDNYILYHNYEVMGREFDFLLIEPMGCLYIIEVKGWTAAQILEVENKNKVRYKDNRGEIKEITESPLDQVRKYKFNLVNKIRNEFGFSAKVVHLVCYPLISRSKFYDKSLSIISEESITLLRDDFFNKQAFLKKIKLASDNYKEKNEELDEDRIYKIRTLFQSRESIDCRKRICELEKLEYDIKIDEVIDKAIGKYSLVIYINDILDNEIIEKLFKIWKSGTKTYIVTSQDSNIKNIKEYFTENASYLKKYDDFKMEKNNFNVFNLFMYKVNSTIFNKSFISINGKENMEKLKILGEYTNFNYEQFILEHYEEKKDMIVQAGAGSGKTYSMISRIVFLIYKHKYTPNELYQKIFLITFTNEASHNMRIRLKKYYMNLFILTQKQINFEFIEAISRMNICTIHSLAKAVINKFSSEIGIGKNSRITQNMMEKRKIINEVIDEFMKDNYKNQDILEIFNFRTYKLTEIISQFIEKIEQKNINLKDGYDFGVADEEIEKLISYVVPRIQERMIEESIKNDTVRLSEIILLLKSIVKNKNEITRKKISLDYLFVDEFQDTDNVQIDLINEFKSILGFNLFVVGDVKQCIYRFRGAENDAFDRLTQGKEIYKTFNLTKNYRSDQDLLDKLHSIFNIWGRCNHLIYNEDSRLKGVKSIAVDGENFISIKYKDNNLEESFIKVLESEIKVLERSYKETGKEKSIAILVRQNRDIETIKRMCDRNGIYIDADVSGNLYSLDSTRDFYLVALALLNNKDPKCLFNILDTNYTTVVEDRTKLFKLKGNRSELIRYFNELNPIEGWDKYIEKIKFEPVMKVLRELIFTIKPWKIYSYKFDKDKLQNEIFYKRNLEQLIESIINTTNRDYLTLNKLVTMLRINIQTGLKVEARESVNTISFKGINVVCKTIHKSKGLEYDTVLLPYLYKNLSENKPKGEVEVIVGDSFIAYSIVQDDPLSENRDSKQIIRISNTHFYKEYKEEKIHKFNEEARILYVALTRAISKVVYFSLDKLPKKNEKRAQDLIECK